MYVFDLIGRSANAGYGLALFSNVSIMVSHFANWYHSDTTSNTDNSTTQADTLYCFINTISLESKSLLLPLALVGKLPVNEAGVAFYNRVIDTLISKKIQPLVATSTYVRQSARVLD